MAVYSGINMYIYIYTYKHTWGERERERGREGERERGREGERGGGALLSLPPSLLPVQELYCSSNAAPVSYWTDVPPVALLKLESQFPLPVSEKYL